MRRFACFAFVEAVLFGHQEAVYKTTGFHENSRKIVSGAKGDKRLDILTTPFWGCYTQLKEGRHSGRTRLASFDGIVQAGRQHSSAPLRAVAQAAITRRPPVAPRWYDDEFWRGSRGSFEVKGREGGG